MCFVLNSKCRDVAGYVSEKILMFIDILGQAYSALRHNRRRASLTMLGMAWGIATVVLLLAYGAGFERALMYFFNSMGSNMVAIFPGRSSLQAGGTKAGTEVRFTIDDVDYLRDEAVLTKRVSPFSLLKNATVQNDTRSAAYTVAGVYPSYQDIRTKDPGEGRLLNEQDELGHARVCIISDKVRRKLFTGAAAVGQTLRIN